MKLLFLVSLILVHLSACNSAEEKQTLEMKFKQIEKGINKTDVIKILGSPANTQLDSGVGSIKTECMYYDLKSSMNFSSDEPTICLDSNKNVVLVIPAND